MPVIDVLWDLPDDPNGNVTHIAEHGLVPADVEYALNHPSHRGRSRSSGLPIVHGRLQTGELIMVVFEQVDDSTVYPITAYQVEE